MADSQIHVALAGNPNCGKTTLFNLITGSNGYVGNWPGVTVEKKQAKLSRDKSVTITDLPGIYSLSPYSPEEQVSRDYIMSGEPNVVINLVDATNLERNLYLTLQVIETGVPTIVALNMADLVEKNGDKIDTKKLSKALGAPVVMVSAIKNTGVDELLDEAKKLAKGKGTAPVFKFDASIEDVLKSIEALLPSSVPANKRRYYAVKLFERDGDATKLVKLPAADAARVEALTADVEERCEDDAESIITGERYALIAHIIDGCYKKAASELSISEKIDKVVTNRILGLPIFIAVMFLVYYIAVSTIGATATDWANDELFGEGWELFGIFIPGIPDVIGGWLEAGGADPDGMVYSLVIDGVVGGLGAIFGFVPQMFILFIMLSFLEDCGYMARVAFIMDRVFRKFGLSGKSFIPMLVSTGCGVPGVMSTKTIENEKDRRMTVMTTTFMPCGAKLPIIALLMGAIIGDSSTEAGWIAPLFYFLGIAAVVISGIMLKKTKIFRGKPTPFVMELPAYHMPSLRSWALHVLERCWAFIKKAGTLIFASTVVVWFLMDFGTYEGTFGFLPAMEGIPEEFTDYSVLAMLGSLLSWIFVPLGFGLDASGAWNWEAVAMTVSGLVAKENVVATAGSILHIADAAEDDPSLWVAFAGMFGSTGDMIAFGAFNLLCAPCFAAMGTIANQMNSGKWTAIALGYECGFAYVIALIISAGWNAFHGVFNIWSLFGLAALVFIIYMLVKPMPDDAWDEEEPAAAAAAA